MACKLYKWVVNIVLQPQLRAVSVTPLVIPVTLHTWLCCYCNPALWTPFKTKTDVERECRSDEVWQVPQKVEKDQGLWLLPTECASCQDALPKLTQKRYWINKFKNTSWFLGVISPIHLTPRTANSQGWPWHSLEPLQLPTPTEIPTYTQGKPHSPPIEHLHGCMQLSSHHSKFSTRSLLLNKRELCLIPYCFASVWQSTQNALSP